MKSHLIYLVVYSQEMQRFICQLQPSFGWIIEIPKNTTSFIFLMA